MGTIIIVVFIAYLLYKAFSGNRSEKKAEEWRPSFEEGYTDPPAWVADHREKERKREVMVSKYQETHFYDLDNRCWVRELNDGTYIRSIDLSDYLNGVPDNSGDEIYTGRLITYDIFCLHYDEDTGRLDYDYFDDEDE